MPKPHGLMRSGLGHQQALLQGRRQTPAPPRSPVRRWRPAAGPARPARPGTPSPPAPPADCAGSASIRAGQQPGHLGARPGGRAMPPRPTATRPPVAVSSPSRRSALSSSTVSYGIAAGVRIDHLGQLGRRGLVHVQHLGDHRDQAGRRQVGQPQLPHPGLLPPPRQQRRQRMRRIHVAFPVRAHQQQALDRLLAEHEVEQAERGAPGPLQVVDEHHHRPLPRGDRPQDLHTRCAAPGPARSADPPDRAAPPAASRTPAPPRSVRPAFGAERPQDPLADAGQLVLRLGQQQPAQRPERLVDPRRTPGPAGTGRTCRPRTSHPCRSPPAAARRPARSCPPPAPR